MLSRSFASHTLTDRGQNTGRPGADSGSRRGTWVRQGGGPPPRRSPLPHPSSSSLSRRCPCCPWQNPRSLAARRAGQRRRRAAAPRIATAGGSNVATSLTYTPEETEERGGAESVVIVHECIHSVERAGSNAVWSNSPTTDPTFNKVVICINMFLRKVPIQHYDHFGAVELSCITQRGASNILSKCLGRCEVTKRKGA